MQACDVVIGSDYEYAGRIKVTIPNDESKRANLYDIGAKALREMDSPYDDVDRHGESFTLGW